MLFSLEYFQSECCVKNTYVGFEFNWRFFFLRKPIFDYEIVLIGRDLHRHANPYQPKRKTYQTRKTFSLSPAENAILFDDDR